MSSSADASPPTPPDVGAASADAPAAAAGLPDALRLGAVHLTVTDLERSVAFYEEAIGLLVHRRADASTALGAGGEDLLVLVDEPAARPAGRHAGLYHFALLHPSRLELARATQRLAATRTPIQGASDHGISEAIYLPDPDGNGIELAADRPRERWGDLRDPTTIGPRPLDLDALLDLVDGAEPQAGADRRLTVGHVHLHIGDIEKALGFYRDLVGFKPMTVFDSAAFVAAGGYHHHLGLNTWRGTGVPPMPEGTVGLRHWTLLVPSPSDLDQIAARLRAGGVEPVGQDHGFEIRDPWGIATRFGLAN